MRGIILKFKDSLDVPLDVIKEERDYQQTLALCSEKYSPFTKDKSNLFFGTYFQTTKKAVLAHLCFDKRNLKEKR